MSNKINVPIELDGLPIKIDVPIEIDDLPAELIEACYRKRELEYRIEDIKYYTEIYTEIICNEMDFDYNSIKESDFEDAAREFLDNHDTTCSDESQMCDICQVMIAHIKIRNQRL